MQTRSIIYSSLSILFLILSANSIAKPVELDRIVAVVNEEIILASELEQEIETTLARLKQNNIQIPPQNLLEKQVLDHLILTRLQLWQAGRTGIRVDDQQLNRTIMHIAEQNRMSLTQFRQALIQEGLPYEVFREKVRTDITLSQLKKRYVESHIRVSTEEIENHLKSQAQQSDSGKQYQLGHILIAIPEAASPEQIKAAKDEALAVMEQLNSGADFSELAISVSDGAQALNGGILDWKSAAQLPSLFSEIVPQMSVNDIHGPIQTPGGFHIIKLIATQDASRHIVEQALVRHILIQPDQVLSEEDAKLQLEQIRSRIVSGESFETLALSHSDDKASAANGGKMDWAGPDLFVPEFQEVVSSLQPGELSQVFRTRFGWHIVELLDRRKHDDTDDYRRTQAREDILTRKTEEEYILWLRRIRNEAYVEIRI